MKIVLVNSLYAPHFVGGAELSVQILAEALARRGHAVHVICLAPARGKAEVNGVRVWYLPLRNVYWPFDNRPRGIAKLVWHARDLANHGMAEDVGKIIDEVGPDVVHTNNITGFSVAVLGSVRKRRVRLVHTLRDYYLLCLRSSMRKGDRNCATRCLECWGTSSGKRWFAEPADFVVGISSHILHAHSNAGWFRSTPSAVIHNPFAANLKREASPHGGALRFGYMGRLSPNKGLENLLHAFEKVGRNGRAELSIAGEGTPEDVTKYRTMAACSAVRFLGYARPDEFFPNIDVLIVPSLWNEPLGRVVIEAFCYGVPVLASNRGGLPELISGGETGFLFEPENVSDLCGLMTKLCGNSGLVARLSDGAQAAAQRFSPDKIAARYENAYRGALNV